MSDIYVPPSALRSQLTFKDWYERVSYQLFQDAVESPPKFDLEKLTPEQNIEFVETVMRHVNNVFYDNPELIDYKTKNRKYSCRKTDIISTTCIILLTNFKITYKEVANIFKLNHSTIIYYVKRHAAYCATGHYRSKYLRLLTQLQYERIIPTVKDKGYEPQQLVSTLLSGIRSKSRTPDLSGNGDKEAPAYGDALSRLGINR